MAYSLFVWFIVLSRLLDVLLLDALDKGVAECVDAFGEALAIQV